MKTMKTMKISPLIILLGWLIIFMGCSKDDEGIMNVAPSMADQSFTVLEDAIVGLAIGTVEASDPDGDSLVFSLTELNSEPTFEINSLSGEITPIRALNFNELSSYSLIATVTDGQLDTEATITINVTPSDAVVNFPPFPGNTFFNGVLRGQCGAPRAEVWPVESQTVQDLIEKKSLHLQ